MGNIYSQATNVIVWLGVSDPASTIAFRLLSDPGQWTGLLGSSVDLAEKLRAMRSLCLRGYWRRLWIVQEVLLAAKISIHCGSDSCSWLRLCWFLDTIAINPTSWNKGENQNSGIEDITNAICATIPAQLFHQRGYKKFMSNTNNPRPLLFLCLQFAQAECEEPRDKVYALRSLAADCCKAATVVEYSTTLLEIYRRVLVHNIHHHIDTNIRIQYGQDQAPSGQVSVNVWIYNPKRLQLYHRQNLSKRLGTFQRFHQYLNITSKHLLYRALDKAQGSELVQQELSTLKEIHLQGFATSRIRWISPPLNELYNEICLKDLESTKFVPIDSKYSRVLCNQGQVQNYLVNSEVDLVCSTTSGISHARTYGKGLALLENLSCENGDRQSFLIDDLKLVLPAAQRAVSEGYSKACRLAIDENGLIYFAPVSVQLGDIICRFSNSDVVAVVRSMEGVKARELFYNCRACSGLPQIIPYATSTARSGSDS